MKSRIICDAHDIELMISRLAAQILEEHPNDDNMLVIGIQSRGVELAQRLTKILEKFGKNPLLGTLDINLYRDDWTTRPDGIPSVGSSNIPASLDGELVLLVDDVLFSGRTVRAALEAILDYGRPNKIELLVLIDRGHRELPICAHYVGKYIATRKTEHVDVALKPRDNEDSVILMQQ